LSHCLVDEKYRNKVLQGDIRFRVRDICRQVCREKGVEFIRGVLSADHVHMFVSVPPKLAISDFVRPMKGRSFHEVQREFQQLKKRQWGKRFLGRGYFSTTNGAILCPARHCAAMSREGRKTSSLGRLSCRQARQPPVPESSTEKRQLSCKSLLACLTREE
jgi:putative transposase